MPSLLVTRALAILVPVLRMATAAPGTTPPLGSVNVPVIVPAPVFCAQAALAPNTRTSTGITKTESELARME